MANKTQSGTPSKNQVCRYSSVDKMLASNDKPQGPGSIAYAGAYKYEELAAQETDWHVLTSGGIKRKVLPDGFGSYYFEAFGPKYGSSDDNSDLLERAARAATNAQLKLTGQFSILKTVKITNPVELVGEGCVILDPNDLYSVLHFTHANSSIRNVKFKGSETLPKFQADLPKTALDIRSFVRFSAVHNIRVSEIKGSGKRALVFMDDCYNSVVSDCRMEGFLPTVTAGDSGQAEANKCAAVCILGGAGNTVTRINAQNHGSIVLSGRGTRHIQITEISGRSLHDNGVYCSSGTDGLVEKCYDISDVIGTGIKCRGSRNVIQYCHVRRCGVGFVMTGDGVKTDAYGANGSFNKLLNSTTEDDDSYPWQADIQDGLWQRDLTIMGMLSLNGSKRGGRYAANVRVVSGLIYKHNTMIAHKGQHYALIISGTKGKGVHNTLVSGNNFFDGEASAIRLQYVDSGEISNNEGEGNQGPLIDLRYVNNLEVANNLCLDTEVVRWPARYPGRGCVIKQNNGTKLIGRALRDDNYID